METTAQLSEMIRVLSTTPAQHLREINFTVPFEYDWRITNPLFAYDNMPNLVEIHFQRIQDSTTEVSNTVSSTVSSTIPPAVPPPIPSTVPSTVPPPIPSTVPSTVPPPIPSTAPPIAPPIPPSVSPDNDSSTVLPAIPLVSPTDKSSTVPSLPSYTVITNYGVSYSLKCSIQLKTITYPYHYIITISKLKGNFIRTLPSPHYTVKYNKKRVDIAVDRTVSGLDLAWDLCTV